MARRHSNQIRAGYPVADYQDLHAANLILMKLARFFGRRELLRSFAHPICHFGAWGLRYAKAGLTGRR